MLALRLESAVSAKVKEDQVINGGNREKSPQNSAKSKLSFRRWDVTTMKTRFINTEHRDFFMNIVSRTQTQNDPYRAALFYVLGLTHETRRNIESLYDFERRGIKIDGLNAGWQTGTSTKITRLAFNLYNDFSGENEKDSQFYTPSELFCHELAPYCLEAIKLRYSEYFREMVSEKSSRTR